MRSPVRRVRPAAWVIALGLAASAGLLLARDVQGVRADLVAGRAEALSARAAMDRGDLGAAADALLQADTRFDQAAQRRSSVVWRAARRVPVVGHVVQAVDETSEAGGAAVDLGHAVLTALLDAQLDGQGHGDTARGLPLDALRDLGAVLHGPTMQALLEATADLREPLGGWVPGTVRSAREEMLAVADEGLATLEPVRMTTSVLPGFLGAEQPRRYLLAMQNSAELRGTGGLIGFHSVLTVDDGHLDFADPKVDDTLDLPGAPLVTDAPFQARYGRLGAGNGLTNANLDPDFPTTARLLVGIHEAATGDVVDGVIAVDPTALSQLLIDGPPITVPPPDHDSSVRLPLRISPEALPRVLMVDAYEALGGGTDERKAYHAAVARAAFERVRHLGLDRETLERLADLVAGRHVQIYSVQSAEQRVFERLGVAGRLAAARQQDLLAVTANNSGGTKQDVHVRHRLVARIHLTPDPVDESGVPSVGRRGRLRVEVDNPLPSKGRDPYILGAARKDDGTSTDLAGTNRTWFTTWTLSSSRVSHGRGADGPLRASTSTYRDMLAIDHLLETPPESSAGYDVAYDGPVDVRQEDDRLVYELLLWRQAKAIADHVDLEVTTADGWRVVAGGVDGPSAAGRLGFGEKGAPLTMSITDDGVRVTGTATGDVRVTVAVSPARGSARGSAE